MIGYIIKTDYYILYLLIFHVMNRMFWKVKISKKFSK